MLFLWSAFAAAVLYDQGWKVGYGLFATLIAAAVLSSSRRGAIARMAELDPETLDRLRTLAPRAVYDQVREALYRLGAVTSDDFREVYEDLVAEGS
jgi:hypothetical protein